MSQLSIEHVNIGSFRVVQFEDMPFHKQVLKMRQNNIFLDHY